MKAFSSVANGKINLSLDITGIRPDGYHEVAMVMHTVPLFDVVTVEVSDGEGIILEVSDETLPTDNKNIAYRAAEKFLEKIDKTAKIYIRIKKNIPVGAGMAGGSTNAAAVLKCLNRAFDEKLDEKELMEIGLSLGADVPFCIKGGCCLSEGIGEVLTEIPTLKGKKLLVAKPNFSVSTKDIYTEYDRREIKKRPDTKAVIEAVKSNDIVALKNSTHNVLEEVTKSLHPEIGEIEGIMYSHNADLSMMTGSGPTVFGFFQNDEDIKTCAEKLKETLKDVCILKI